MECSKCNRVVQKDWESCAYCGAELRRGFFAKILGFFADQQQLPAEKPPTETEAPEENIRDSSDFFMKVEDVFFISGRGVVVVGKAEGGVIYKGAMVQFRAESGTPLSCKVFGIEQFRKTIDYAEPGENIGLLLADIEKDDIARGTVVKGN